MFEIFFDGACEPVNPGGTAAYGFLIKKDGETIAQESKIIGNGKGMTNNLAEYYGLLAALKTLHTLKTLRLSDQLMIYTDSNLVYNMISKNWGWNKSRTSWRPHKNHPHLRKLLDEILTFLEKLNYQIKWIPREENTRADTLSKLPLIKSGIKTKNTSVNH